MGRIFANVYKRLDSIEHAYSEVQSDERLVELQQEIMSLVRLNAKTELDAGSYSKEYEQLTAEMERWRALRQNLLDRGAQNVIRNQRNDELRQFVQ